MERWGGITDGSHLGGGASGVWEFMLPRTLSHLIDQKGRGPPAYSGDLSRPRVADAISRESSWSKASFVLVTY